MDKSIAKISIALMKNELTKDVLVNPNNKFFLRNRDAFYLAMDDQYNFTGAYLKKGPLGWNVKLKLDFNEISFADHQREPITCVVINLGRKVLITCRYQLEKINHIKVNNQAIEKFEIREFNKAFGFILEAKNNQKVMKGFNSDGQLTYSKEINEEGVILRERF